MRVAVLGSSGMLGRAVKAELSRFGFEVVTFGRSGCDFYLGVGEKETSNLNLQGVSYAVNCIGVISHLINEDDPASCAEAANINSVFPHQLAIQAESQNVRVIQIATDCVFSGSKGSYIESSSHDATDVYGRTKSLGEVVAPNFMNLRTSIVGRETRGFHSLLEWVIRRPRNSELNGFIDRRWNGVTTEAFARIVRGLIEKDLFKSGLQHIVPQETLSKADLVRLIAHEFGRDDIRVKDVKTGSAKDLTLSTENPGSNFELWLSAGYPEIPSIPNLIKEISS